MKYTVKNLLLFYKKNKRMPSYAELSVLYGFRSKNSAFSLAERLIVDGYLEKDQQGKLLPGCRLREIPLLGSVQAGFPSVGEESMDESLSLDEWLVNDHDATFLLRVSGDSMFDAGIIEGDYVVVERGAQSKIGDIIIAEVDGEWTMKYLRRADSGYYLEAANANYPNIYPEGDLKIHAVVRSLVRKYESHKR